MSEKMSTSYMMIAIMSIVNSSIYGVVYMRGSFYNIMQEALQLTHTQMGNLWTLYGIVAMVSYLFGGILSDRVGARKLIYLSTIGIIISGFWLSLCPPYPVLCVLFILFGIFAIFTYYPVSIKIISLLSQNTGNGKGFGSYWGLNGIVNVIAMGCGILIVHIFPDNANESFQWVCRVYVLMVIVGLVLFWKIFQMPPSLEELSAERQTVKEMLCDTAKIIKDARVWMIIGVIMTNFFVISSFSYFTPFMKEALAISESMILTVNLVRGDILGIFAPIVAGILSDYWNSTVKAIHWISAGGVILLILLLICMHSGVGVIFTVIMITIVYLSFIACKGILMSILGESGVNTASAGNLIGFIAFVGYMPDAFYYTVAGKVVDHMGLAGYSYIFGFDIASAIVTVLLCAMLYKRNNKGRSLVKCK